PGMERHFREFAKHVIDGRTALMHYRLFMPLREGHVFAAVGATHLYGRRGLLALIQQDGYRVTKLW
ncbi:MAG TPA: TraB/GumN family protein, partial [Casimicrobiaceae bacterium]|nr:TraB/GumN family protein [Casimicrobiaceae bacterium]